MGGSRCTSASVGGQRLGSCSSSRPLVSGVRTAQRLGEQCSAPLALDIFFPPRALCFGQQLQCAPASCGTRCKKIKNRFRGKKIDSVSSSCKPHPPPLVNHTPLRPRPDRGMFEIWCVRSSGPSGGDGSGGGRSKAKRGMAAGCAAGLQQPRLLEQSLSGARARTYAGYTRSGGPREPPLGPGKAD